jgi:cation diffusion facilitator CzcD-associated flavoprotein CzcO
MPKDMWLKSDGFASNLSDPAREYPLAEFCREKNIDYHDKRIPVRLDTFAEYGLAFQRRFAPQLDERRVSALQGAPKNFVLTLEDGAVCRAKSVVVAVGIGDFLYIPPELAELPPSHVSHSYDHCEFTDLAARRVAVIGAGASAIDLAGLLKDAGGDVRLIARRKALKFSGPPGPDQRSLWSRLRHPSSGLGPGWRSRLSTDAPLLFHFLPARARREIVRRHLGPAASWRMREKVVSRIPVLTGRHLVGASVKDGRAELILQAEDLSRQLECVDHVVAATGYRVDLSRLKFLSAGLRSKIACSAGAPVLSTGFESSVTGLYFVGPSAADSFGPLMRFAFGAEFAARQVTEKLRRQGAAVAEARGREARAQAPAIPAP